MKQISISKGYKSLVDDDDYEKIAALKWTADIRVLASGNLYIIARRNCYNDNKRTSAGMQNFVLGIFPWEIKGYYIDHINRDSLDNRKENLRIVTPIVSSQNTSFCLNATYIHFDTSRNKWMAMVNRKFLGRTSSKEEALKLVEGYKQCAS